MENPIICQIPLFILLFDIFNLFVSFCAYLFVTLHPENQLRLFVYRRILCNIIQATDWGYKIILK